MIHEQATDQPYLEQARHRVTRPIWAHIGHDQQRVNDKSLLCRRLIVLRCIGTAGRDVALNTDSSF
jgi:hypothetical protein